MQPKVFNVMISPVRATKKIIGPFIVVCRNRKGAWRRFCCSPECLLDTSAEFLVHHSSVVHSSPILGASFWCRLAHKRPGNFRYLTVVVMHEEAGFTPVFNL